VGLPQPVEMGMTDRSGYSTLQIGLHWGIAALILFNYLYSDGMEDSLDGMMEAGGSPVAMAGWHVWVGVAVLALVLVRLGVRTLSGVPEPLGDRGSLMVRAAGIGHLLLYVLMVAVPVGGTLAWFWGVEDAGDLHIYAANALMILAGVHAAASLVHHFLLKDRTLVRMLGRA
jgi:cytochrome b561